jgi:flap endonuclease-1
VTKYETALTTGKLEEAKRYAQGTSSLKDLMIDDAHKLLRYLGVPIVQAPSEGEAQAAHMAARGDVWAAVSQDYDSLLFGAPRLVRNLAISGRRKLPLQAAFVQVEPELVDLESNLQSLGFPREQLVELGILIGTDFNPEGFKGIGPKTALKLVREYGTIEKIAESTKTVVPPPALDRIREIFLKPEVTSNYDLNWRESDVESLVQFLCGERDFSEERVRTAVERARATMTREAGKKTLESFFQS